MARLCLPPLSKIGACVQLKIRGHTPQSIVGQGRPNDPDGPPPPPKPCGYFFGLHACVKL
jgi:hypothetical protein